ncbi:MAG TPA: DoxX family protein [Candidatus Nanoarchaeia archaeon]|nr:DoxX family protein [Candidatus Nanoarchaeia archaeon]
MKEYSPFALRIGIGGIFVIAGIMKLMDPQMIVGMLEGFGFPGPSFWAWLLILVELLCGAAVLTGFRLKYSTVPLAIVMFVAIVVSLDNIMIVLNNLVIMSGLISLWLSGPGAWSLGK